MKKNCFKANKDKELVIVIRIAEYKYNIVYKYLMSLKKREEIMNLLGTLMIAYENLL